jgi:hypothetical protein
MRVYRWGIVMKSPKVHLAGCTRSVRLRDGVGVGATPAAWGGFTSLPRPFDQAQGGEPAEPQARDGEPVESLEGDHAHGVTASQNGSKRFFAKLSIVIVLLVAWGAACAPRQIKPVAAIDPAPLLERVNTRRIAFEQGLSGTLELAYKNGKQRFKGRTYIVAYPDGRFRLEVPGTLGDTLLVMASDNHEILAFYPGENKAFRSAVDGKSLSPHLPFPLPVDPTLLPALIMGVFPKSGDPSGAEAHIMNSGEKLLTARSEDTGLQFTWLFDKASKDSLRKITIRGKDMEVSVRTRQDSEHLPRDFDLTMANGVLKGEWDSVAPFGGNEAALELRIPDFIQIIDLETAP